MEEYEIKEIMSGIENEFLWVTIGFSSELENNDVLHKENNVLQKS